MILATSALGSVPDIVWTIVTQLGTGIVGVVVGIFLRTVLPDPLRDRIVYFGSRVKKYSDNDTFGVRVSWKYRTDDPVELSELIEAIQSEFGESPTSYNKFRFEKSFANRTVEIEIRPSYSSGVGSAGKVDPMADTVRSILVTCEADPSYRELTDALFDLQDADRSVGERITSLGFDRQSSAAKCDLPAKPTIQKLLGEGRLDTIRGESDTGARVDFSSNEVQIESLEGGAISSTIKRAIVFYG